MPVIVIAANLLNSFQQRRAHQLGRLVKSHAQWFPLENPRKPVLHSFKSWIQTECEANEANITISSISLLTLKLTLLARCCRLPQLLLFVYFVSKGRPFSGREQLWVAPLPSQRLCVG